MKNPLEEFAPEYTRAERVRFLAFGNRAIVQLESVTQENAGLVEAAAASSHSFEQEAHRLTEVVARFRIVGGPAPARRRDHSPAGQPRLVERIS
jgi:hypothetical protein